MFYGRVRRQARDHGKRLRGGLGVKCSMDRALIIQKFATLGMWKRGGERAPHKPLLVLYAIRKLLRGESRLIPYCEIDEGLGKLLQEFGPRRSRQGSQYPFWRLRNDSVWEITNAYQIVTNSSGDARKSDLLAHRVFGGFRAVIATQLQNDAKLTFAIIHNLLDTHFPPSIHGDILQAVNIEPTLRVFDTRRRDSHFRENVLRAYEYKCSICGFDVKLGHSPIGLEASHIKWHAAGGPNQVVNGLTLCVLHHKLFDRGAFTLSKQWGILVSEDAHGSVGFQEWLMRFHGKKINFPQRQSYYPKVDFIDWHVREVFQGAYREL